MTLASLIEKLETRIAPASFGLGTGTTSTGDVTFGSGDTLGATLNDVAGSGKLAVTGSVTIASGTLAIEVSQIPADGQSFVLIDNDGTDLISGVFPGLPEGAVFLADGTYFKISYEGNDGNDLTLQALVPRVTIAANQKSATYVDVDGDVVTLKTTVGSFTPDAFKLVPTGDTLIGGAQLVELRLDSTFEKANLTITARPGDFGTGFANIGYLNATGVNLGVVKLKGDLARIDAGGGPSGSTAIRGLTVNSIGLLGDSTLASPVDPLLSTFAGRVAALTVKTDVRKAYLISETGFGNVTVGGSFFASELLSGSDIGAIKIGRDLAGDSSEYSVISAFGKAVAPTRGTDLAIKSISVGGNVEHTTVLAGYTTSEQALNADASVGPVLVRGDWVASSLIAGTTAGLDGYIGTGDDSSAPPSANPAYRNNSAIVSQIASITIQGQVIGTADDPDDSFGFVAERIKKMTIGGTALRLGPLPHDDFIPLAPTNPGPTTVRSDVYLVEVLPLP